MAVSAALSTVEASPATNVVADGVASSTITVTVRDSFGNVKQGETVMLSALPVGAVFSTSSPVTNASGVATATITSTKAETKTISAMVGATAIADTATVAFVHGPASVIELTSGAGQGGSPGAVLAPFVVTVKDAFGNLVSGATVSFVQTGGNGTLSTASAVTGANGVAQTTLTLGNAGTQTVEARIAGLTSVAFRAVALSVSAKSDVATGGTQLNSLVAADLSNDGINGDGMFDLVVPNPVSNTVSVLFGR